ncbi:MAG: inositol monophosphatase [Oceanospirillales bacterium]|nr:inositol monophosphatase [Oceanospirillales bacterium]
MVNIALRAARLAGEQISRALERLDLIKTEQADVAEFISELCMQAERTITTSIQKAYPQHSVIGEYSGTHSPIGEGPGHCEWHISPIDSLTNFSNALPMFALSVTGFMNGKAEHCVVINPVFGEEFTASRGKGAQLNGKRLRVGNRTALDGAIIGTGYHGRSSDKPWIESHARMMQNIMEAGATLHNSGSPVLSLAYTAAGRLDGFYQIGLSSTELSAGLLLIREAGGLVGDFSGGNKYSERGNLVTGNTKVLKALLRTLHPATDPALR